MGGEARIGLEGRVDGVVGEVEEERLPLLGGSGDEVFGLQGERFGEEEILAVIFFEVRNGMAGALGRFFAEVLSSEIAAGSADGSAGDVDVEAEFGRVGSVGGAGTEMALADVKRAVAGVAEETGQSDIAGLEPAPVPRGGTLGAGVVRIGIDPVRGVVTGGVLAGQDRDASGRAHAHRAEVVESDAAGSQALHRGGAVKMVERLPLGPAGSIGDKRDGRVHHAQIIDQKDDEVGLGGRGGERKTEEEEGGEEGAGAGLAEHKKEA